MASGDLPAMAHVTYSQQFRRCNKLDCPTCRGGGPGHGPYWYASWRQDGQRRTRYLGKTLPPDLEVAGKQPASMLETVSHPALRIRTLGGFTVWRGAAPILAAAWSQRKVTALFKCLLSAQGQRLPRETLAELLWPEVTPEASARHLRQAVFRLRRVLSDGAASGGYLRQEGDLLVLDPAPQGQPALGWLDASAFEAAAVGALAGVDTDACRAALALYGGEYLPDDRYEDWAIARREGLRRQHLALLLHLAGLREQQGVLGEAARCLRALLADDPCHEPAARALMRVQTAAGSRSAAVRTYKQLALALERDLALRPDEETEAQYQALLTHRQAAEARRTNLPTPLTSFLGREQELATLAAILQDDQPRGSRLLTLVGPGGCGKSRLAVELGHEVRRQFPDGVWLIELAALASDAGPLAESPARQTCAALGLRETPDQSPVEALVTHLSAHQALLILDNCEHVIAGSTALAVSLLEHCPGLRVLATSREALGAIGERLWRIPSLANRAAIRLLVERAQAVRSGFTLTAGNRGSAAEVCRRLDGIPLAIELAAARLAALSVEELAARLDDRFALLAAGNRAASPRHQTLRATLDWSYELLDARERLLLCRLCVFAGAWALEAAEAVCAGELPAGSLILTTVADLVAKSLVQADEQGAYTQYRLLETVRAYGRERLAVEELDALRDRHLAYYLTLAETANTALSGPAQQDWLERLETAHDDLRAALGWGLVDRPGEAGVRLAGVLWRFWMLHGHLGEGRRWLEAARIVEAPPATRARALIGAGNMASTQGDHARAMELYEETLALSRAASDARGIQSALSNLGNTAYLRGDYARASILLEEALALARAGEHGYSIAHTLEKLGNVALDRGDFAQAEARFAEALGVQRAIGDPEGIALALTNLGVAAQEQADYARAVPLYEEALAMQRALGDWLRAACSLTNLAMIALEQGDRERARRLEEESVALKRTLGDKSGLTVSLSNLGELAAAAGDVAQAWTLHRESLELACGMGERRLIAEALEALARLERQPHDTARLLGAATALRQAIGAPIPPSGQARHELTLSATRAALGDTRFETAWQAGQTLSLEALVAELRHSPKHVRIAG